jgi:hypothetical protein
MLGFCALFGRGEVVEWLKAPHSKFCRGRSYLSRRMPKRPDFTGENSLHTGCMSLPVPARATELGSKSGSKEFLFCFAGSRVAS